MNVDFGNKILAHITVGGATLSFTENMRNTCLVCVLLIASSVVLHLKTRSPRDVPSGIQNISETLVESFAGMVKDATGKENGFCGAWFFSVFLFILFSNYSGLLGLRPPTASLSTTLALSLVTFATIHITGIVSQGGDYFKGYLEPMPLFLPMNVLSALSVPISLSFRLFGNILGGMIIMKMLYEALPAFFKLFVPVPFHLYFDIFAGAVQAVIFTMLGLLFIGEKLPQKS